MTLLRSGRWPLINAGVPKSSVGVATCEELYPTALSDGVPPAATKIEESGVRKGNGDPVAEGGSDIDIRFAALAKYSCGIVRDLIGGAVGNSETGTGG